MLWPCFSNSTSSSLACDLTLGAYPLGVMVYKYRLTSRPAEMDLTIDLISQPPRDHSSTGGCFESLAVDLYFKPWWLTSSLITWFVWSAGFSWRHLAAASGATRGEKCDGNIPNETQQTTHFRVFMSNVLRSWFRMSYFLKYMKNRANRFGLLLTLL